MTLVSHPRLGSSPSKRTLSRRTKSVESYRESIGGDVNVHALELRHLAKQERQEILKCSGLTLEVPPGEGLAMKSDLGIPWNKLRHLRRFVLFIPITVNPLCQGMAFFKKLYLVRLL